MYLRTERLGLVSSFTAPIGYGHKCLSVSASPVRGTNMSKPLAYLPEYSLCSVAAIDQSMTELVYSEVCNRDGILPSDIGMAVINAIFKLEDPASIGQVIVRFSTDT